MSSFTFYVVFKSLVLQECFCGLQKGQTKTISLCSWTTFAFWICGKVHSPGSTIFEQNIHDLLARLNCATVAFQAVPCKDPLPTLNSSSVGQSLFQSLLLSQVSRFSTLLLALHTYSDFSLKISISIALLPAY